MKITLITVLFFIYSISFGQNQNISIGNVFDGEPYLAINPNNSQHIIVAWMGWVDFTNKFKIKVKSSFDGGESWNQTNELSHKVNGFTSADPSIDFHPNGDIYVSYIDFTGTEAPVTGGVYICKSTDGGLSWNEPNEVVNTEYDGSKWPIDRPWIIIDKSLSSPFLGNIYLTTMNLNRKNPTFNPYLSISTDNGQSFTTSYLDKSGWLAGGINPLPMCSPTISNLGVFYGAYPSLVYSQSPYAQTFLVSSNDGGANFNHKKIITYKNLTNNNNYPFAKKAHLLISNPSNSDHLAHIFLSAMYGDLDVFLIESTNSGETWSNPERINDDMIANNKMQDLIWGDFDSKGNLIISWRDRRNGVDSTYQTPTEIWAAFRSKDSLNFSANFQITNQTVEHDSLLERAGNDFMCIKLQNDTLNAVWGDTRDGRINIWFQRMEANGTVLSVKNISSEELPKLYIYPNPTTSIINIKFNDLKKINLYDMNGNIIISKSNKNNETLLKINVENLSSGNYLLELFTTKGIITHKIIKQ